MLHKNYINNGLILKGKKYIKDKDYIKVKGSVRKLN